ncbi:hypothetical protein GQR58_029192 [Nymphon striatum]|nr:hypothetical protein GQR58_029192 [Nymphon striatum]
MGDHLGRGTDRGQGASKLVGRVGSKLSLAFVAMLQTDCFDLGRDRLHRLQGASDKPPNQHTHQCGEQRHDEQERLAYGLERLVHLVAGNGSDDQHVPLVAIDVAGIEVERFDLCRQDWVSEGSAVEGIDEFDHLELLVVDHDIGYLVAEFVEEAADRDEVVFDEHTQAQHLAVHLEFEERTKVLVELRCIEFKFGG